MGETYKSTKYLPNGKIFNRFLGLELEITDRPEQAFYLGGKCLAACNPHWKKLQDYPNSWT